MKEDHRVIEVYGKRLQAERMKAARSQTDVAKAIGYSPSGIAKWERQDVARIFLKGFEGLAGMLGVTVDELRRRIAVKSITDMIGPGIPLSEDGDFIDSRGKVVNVEKPTEGIVYVPIINAIAAGALAEHTDLGYPPGIADESIPVVGGAGCFALWVIGDSMLPRYEPGDLVVFKALTDEDKIVSGQDYAIQLNGDGDSESTFKRVRLDKSRKNAIIAEAINPDFKPHRTVIEWKKIARMGRVTMILPRWKDVRHR